MPFDPEASLYLMFRDQRGEKNNGRALQFRVGFDLCRYFASVCLWHHDVQQNHVWAKIPCTVIGPRSIVLFEHEIAAGSFEKDFYQMSALPVIIDNQNASFFLE